MLLFTWSNSSLTSGLPLLTLFPHYLMLREVLYLCLKCMNYFSRFMTFWTRLFQNELETQLHILAYLFNSVSRQHCEVWASQFSFLHSLMDVISPSEACLYGHINWSLAQLTISLLWVCLSLFLLARPDQRLGSISQYRGDLCQGL